MVFSCIKQCRFCGSKLSKMDLYFESCQFFRWNLEFYCYVFCDYMGETMNKKPPMPCVRCPKFERVAENAGYCHEYEWMIGIELARRDMVCRDIDESKTSKV